MSSSEEAQGDHPALERRGLVGRQVRARPRDHLAEHDGPRRRRPGRRHGPGRADRPHQDVAHRLPGRPHGDRRPDRRGRHRRDPQHLVRDADGRVLRHPAERQVGRRHLGRDRPRQGRPRHRGLGRAGHGRDDAGARRVCPSSAPARSRPAATRPGDPQPRAASGSGSSDENRAILGRFVEALANADADGGRRVVDTGAFVDHSPGWGTRTSTPCSPCSGRCARDAGPPLRGSTRRTWSARETHGAGHSIVRGTHTGGPLFGAAPSGNELVWTHSDFVRLRTGRSSSGGRLPATC